MAKWITVLALFYQAAILRFMASDEVRRFLAEVGRKGGRVTASRHDMKARSKKGVEARKKKKNA